VLPLANQKQIKLLNGAAGRSFIANVDPHRIVQVLVNLLSNAIKFSPPGGIVTITLFPTDQTIEIKVADQGRGIPEHLWKDVFNRFQQVQKGDATEKGGSGLGLAICKSLIELHNGTISVRSEVGKGSTFTIILPR
jgi:signal transduction histidine kinase